MKNFKLFYLLIALMASTTFAWAQYSGTCGDNLTWEFNPSTTTLTISGTGAMEDYVGAGVTPWHTHKAVIETVSLPAGITHIGKYAFSGFNLLKSIDIPENVTSIGEYAFQDCSFLESITVHWTDPTYVTTNATAFSGIDVFFVTLYVPYETPSLYTTYEPWKSFQLVEMNPSGTCGDNLFWEYDPSTTTLTITGSGAMDNYAGYSSKPWHAWRNDITSVVLPNGLTSIGNNAFYGCLALTSINIPDGLTSIGASAFNSCKALPSIDIPSSVTSIGIAAFANCWVLTSIAIPNGVTAIADNTFNSCKALPSIDIPSSATSIGVAAFMNCQVLESITIPNSVTSIGGLAFQDCSNLANIYVGWTSTPPTPGNDAFTNIASGATFHVPYGTSANYTSAPWNSFTIVEVNPSGRCGDNLFWEYNCSNPDSPTFLHITGTGAMYDYANSTSNEAPWNGYKANIQYLIINKGATTIGNDAFYGCTGLKSATIPTGVISIGDNAFYGCSGLTSITIPSSVTAIGDYAFAYTSLTDVVVNWDTPLAVNSNIFENIASPAKLHVPNGTYAIYAAADVWKEFTIKDPYRGTCGDNLTWVYETTDPTHSTLTITGTGAMDNYLLGSKGAPWLTYINDININPIVSLPDGLTTIGDYAFYGSTLTSITIPESVTSIGTNAFEYSYLTSIEIKSSEFNIGKEAFRNCHELTSVTIRNSVATIGNKAFYQCENINSVTIQNSVVAIGKDAFHRCYDLESFALTDGSTLTSIGESAFYRCGELTSITIPNTVTNIGNYAFRECTGLTDIYVSWADPSTECEIGEGIFSSVPGSAKLHLPFEAWNNYSTHARWTKFKQVPVITAKADPENAGVYYNTFYHSSVAYALPANVEAYTAKRSGSDLILTKVAQAGQTLPANTAVILKSSVASYEMTPSDATPVTVGENDLQGVDAAETAPANCYVLSGHSSDNSVSGVGFYQFSGTLAAHKAYMVVSGGAGAPKRLRFVFDEEQTATGVESLQPLDVSIQKVMRDEQIIIIRNGVEYNINGQRMK